MGEILSAVGRPADNAFRQALAIVDSIATMLRHMDDHLFSTFVAMPLVVDLKSHALALPQTAPNVAMHGTDEAPAGLTQRELEVLTLIARGQTDRQIAEELTIAVRTVNTHVTNILNKTGCDNRTAAAAFAVAHGIA